MKMKEGAYTQRSSLLFSPAPHRPRVGEILRETGVVRERGFSYPRNEEKEDGGTGKSPLLLVLRQEPTVKSRQQQQRQDRRADQPADHHSGQRALNFGADRSCNRHRQESETGHH